MEGTYIKTVAIPVKKNELNKKYTPADLGIKNKIL